MNTSETHGAWMKITFRTTFFDLAHFTWQYMRTSRVLVLLILALSTYVGWDSSRRLPSDYRWEVAVLTGLANAAFVFMIVFVFGYVVSLLASVSRMNKTVLTECTLEVNDAGLKEENRYGISQFRWEIVQKLWSGGNRFIIYIAQARAIIVPRRAFASETEWNAFRDYVADRSKK